jgi:hypothetical protein
MGCGSCTTRHHEASPKPVGAAETSGSEKGSAGSGGTVGSGSGAQGIYSSQIEPGIPTLPAVRRGGAYMGFPEKFNRYYTDRTWKPGATVYVSPNGNGNGSSRSNATSVASALQDVVPGSMIVFTPGTYSGCYALEAGHGGNYDNPVVLYGERKPDDSLGVVVNCCSSGRKTCFNLEAADHVAIEGFELVGGDYGVRSVGVGYAANKHQKGVAVLNSTGHGQRKDPFFTGQSDWFVIEHCTAYDAGTGDGHGIYLSNGSDWNVARYNETYNTASSDFQINADPLSTCRDEGVAFDDPECDAVAGSSATGGRGASDFMLIEGNFFHHSKAQGPNFTSVRRSVIRNNIFALPTRHGVGFWQETNNPKLGASNNLIAHNLFITSVNNRQLVQFINNSTNNQFKNNVLIAITTNGSTVSANANGQLLETDTSTVNANTFVHNDWISGHFVSRDAGPPYAPNATEYRHTSFEPAWFAAFPMSLSHDPAAFAPTTTAPWLNLGDLLRAVPTDRDGAARHAPVDLGPFER